MSLDGVLDGVVGSDGASLSLGGGYARCEGGHAAAEGGGFDGPRPVFNFKRACLGLSGCIGSMDGVLEGEGN